MRLMMLGILAARAMGHEVVTCDNRPDSVGHAHGTARAHASTFDVAAVIREAQAHAVDGIMTMGTDQPVLTAALAAEALGLPMPLPVRTARAVTDKRVMKRQFQQAGIPTVPWTLLGGADVADDAAGQAAGDAAGDAVGPAINHAAGYAAGHTAGHPIPMSALAPPLVVKPVDSQGQRGVWLVPDAAAAGARLADVLRFSRTDEILVESHYPNEEVTVSGWVTQGEPRLLSITDRVTFAEPERLGVCLSHELPSKHLARHGKALAALTARIVEAFEIPEGPLYFQFLIGAEGIRVNEIACRIGGAFESQFLPGITGFDLTAAAIRDALGLPHPPSQMRALRAFDVFAPGPALSVQLFFCEPCVIGSLTPLPEVLACPGVLDAGYHLAPGQQVSATGDATGRVGYCIVEAPDPEALEARLHSLYNVLAVRDTQGRNRILHRPLKPPTSPHGKDTACATTP